MPKKIKLFLGGYVNVSNAQNLNCRSLALHLDKEKFDIGVMTYPGGSLPMGDEFRGIKRFNLLFPLYRPLRFLRHINYLRALLWCDVAYLPKGEIYHFTQRVSRLLGKKTFTTVEGVMSEENHKNMLRFCGSDDEIRKCYNGFDHTYSITRFMENANEGFLGIKSEGVLYLGVEASDFNVERSDYTALKKLIMIGFNLKHKHVDEFIQLSHIFSDLEFHIVGGDEAFKCELEDMSLKNVVYHGCLDHAGLAKVLKDIDLHIFPSRSEGWGKVTFETAAAGVPSIVYGDYGASEWITTGKDGYVVDSFEQIVDIVSDLNQHPEKLESLSVGAKELAQRFDWSVLVKDWEAAIIEVFKTK